MTKTTKELVAEILATEARVTFNEKARRDRWEAVIRDEALPALKELAEMFDANLVEARVASYKSPGPDAEESDGPYHGGSRASIHVKLLNTRQTGWLSFKAEGSFGTVEMTCDPDPRDSKRVKWHRFDFPYKAEGSRDRVDSIVQSFLAALAGSGVP